MGEWKQCLLLRRKFELHQSLFTQPQLDSLLMWSPTHPPPNHSLTNKMHMIYNPQAPTPYSPRFSDDVRPLDPMTCIHEVEITFSFELSSLVCVPDGTLKKQQQCLQHWRLTQAVWVATITWLLSERAGWNGWHRCSVLRSCPSKADQYSVICAGVISVNNWISYPIFHIESSFLLSWFVLRYNRSESKESSHA